MQPDASARPATRRVRTSEAKGDIENAFGSWRDSVMRFAQARRGGNEAAELIIQDYQEAQARVRAWLAQVEAEQRQLRAALLACQAMAAVTNYSDVDAVHRARKLALDAIAEG